MNQNLIDSHCFSLSTKGKFSSEVTSSKTQSSRTYFFNWESSFAGWVIDKANKKGGKGKGRIFSAVKNIKQCHLWKRLMAGVIKYFRSMSTCHQTFPFPTQTWLFSFVYKSASRAVVSLVRGSRLSGSKKNHICGVCLPYWHFSNHNNSPAKKKLD